MYDRWAKKGGSVWTEVPPCGPCINTFIASDTNTLVVSAWEKLGTEGVMKPLYQPMADCTFAWVSDSPESLCERAGLKAGQRSTCTVIFMYVGTVCILPVKGRLLGIR
jgi:hypothetical protein